MWGKSMSLDGEESHQNIKMLSSGEMDPFILWLKMEDGESYALKGSQMGQVVLFAPGEDPEAKGSL